MSNRRILQIHVNLSNAQISIIVL